MHHTSKGWLGNFFPSACDADVPGNILGYGGVRRMVVRPTLNYKYS